MRDAMHRRTTRSGARRAALRRRALLAAIVASTAVASGTSAQGAQRAAAEPRAARGALTIEAVLGVPFPSEISAAPRGGAIAWVANERGARNIWVAEPPAYRGRRLTSYTADDGQELGALAWSPDGRTIVYVRGGSANRAGEHPNPTSSLDAPTQGVWRIALDGGAPVHVGEGSAPAVSPAGDAIAFLRGGQIVTAPLAGGAATPIGHVRGRVSTLRWSPDGSRLAFVSGRGDHGFVGVYDRAHATITWLAPDVDQDLAPAWSPDGTRIAFVRLATSSTEPFFAANREAPPWSIVVADASTGEGRVVWRAEAGAGSVFAPVESEDQLFWGAGDRIVFPWERDGWRHLYGVPAVGGTATRLTTGDFEVEHVTLTPDRAALLYSSNQGDIDRRHLWRVPVAGGAPSAVTSGRGIEWSPVVTSTGAVALLHSGARRPATAAILQDGRTRELLPDAVPASLAEDAFVEPEPVIYRSADGLAIHGQLFLPPQAKGTARHPALVFVHGGPIRQMLLGFHYMDFYHYSYALNQYFASRGYVVLSVNYRSGTGYGLAFREAEHYGSAGATEVGDVLGAALYLRTRADVDPARIGIYGGSYGGYLTAQALAHASDLFAAGVDYAGVHDWNAIHAFYDPSFDPRADPEATSVARQSSPMAWIDQWRSPVLLIQGDDDRNVPFSETVTLVEQLRAHDVPVEELVFPDEVHDILRYRNLLRFAHATDDFLAKWVAKKDGVALTPARR